MLRGLVTASAVFTIGVFAATAGATCGPTADDAVIQNAIANAVANGGGTVQLEPRVYDICEPVVLHDNIHLVGAGRGATVLRTQQGTDEASPYGGFSIIGSAVSNSSVTDLTLDQRTNGRIADGIVFAADSTGKVPNNILVARTEVIGFPDPAGHQYMIWNYLGHSVKILNNWVNGGFTSVPAGIVAQEGIESYGGYDVLVEGNTVTGVNGSCYNFGQADNSPNPDSELIGLRVANNYATTCNQGINVGTGSNPGQTAAHTIIADNVLIGSATNGISISVGDGTVLRDMNISGNTIRDVGTIVGGSGASVAGIRLTLRSGAATFVMTTVTRNHIDTVAGSPGFGICLEFYDNARLIDNTITTTSNDGISLLSSNAAEIRGNRIEATGTTGISLTPSGIGEMLVDNFITNWGSAADGIHLDGVTYGMIRGNMFRRTDLSRPAPINLTSGTCGVAVWNNVLIYSGTMPPLTIQDCPGAGGGTGTARDIGGGGKQQ